VPLAAPLGAAIGNGAAGAVVLAGALASLVAAVVTPRRRWSVLVTAGTTVRCWLGPAVAAASVVAVYRVAPTAAFGLLVLGAGYDMGAYVWGAGVRRPLASRIAGVVTVVVLTFALSVVHMVLEIEPFQTSAAVWVFGGLAAAACPLGQLVASAILPAAADEAPALRRLDALLLTAPAWALALWSSLG
jgi:hypothetical protein